MKRIVEWAVNNAPGMNTLMLTVLIVGTFFATQLQREIFPEFELDIVLVTVPYPGASPEEVEDGICLRIEEAVRSINGIKKQTSVASEGFGYLVLELESDVEDPQKVLNEVRSEIDRIPSFPDLAEDPSVKQITFRAPAIRVAVIGPDTDDPEAEHRLRDVAEEVRTGILALNSVSQAEIIGVRDYQIDVEIPEQSLRRHGLTLASVADTIRKENLELPSGKLNSTSQQVLLRGNNKRTTGMEIAKIPLVADDDGTVLTVGDLGTVQDGFSDLTAISKFTYPDEGIFQRDVMVVSVDRTSNEDLIEIADEVRDYVASGSFPAGYQVEVWRDESKNVRDRLDLLIKNGSQGLLLVFVVLALFLDLRLSFWVALGIPISVMGCCAILWLTGQTLNMLSMFSFLMALGIVVDDAIVIGENIYSHREQGKGLVRAAIDGTVEVFPSVLASVSTTIVAFAPLLFVTGIMGKFIAVIPVAIIAMLVISLIESMIILPCHLAHRDGWFFGMLGWLLFPFKPIAWAFEYLSRSLSSALNWIIADVYEPLLKFAIRFPVSFLCGAVSVLLLSVGLVVGNKVPFEVFPKLDSNIVEAKIVFPDGTPSSVADAATDDIEQALLAINKEFPEPVVKCINRNVGDLASGGQGPTARKRGSHVGQLTVELVDTSLRSTHSKDIVDEWRAMFESQGGAAGAESVSFGTPSMGPGGTPIEFKLLAPADKTDQLEEAVELVKQKLETYAGVFDVADDSTPGKWEYQMHVKNRAQSLGVSLRDVAGTVRSAYYGDEVMRLQRDRHEVKLMVRYPEEDRKSIAQFNDIRVRTGDGTERPITELVDYDTKQTIAEINRVNQMRSITISADVDSAAGGNAFNTVADLRDNYVSILTRPESADPTFEQLSTNPRIDADERIALFESIQKRFPDVEVRWEGQQEQTMDSFMSLLVGFAVASLVMYFLLTIEFRSYIQPMIVMSIIPYGAIGAIAGHLILDIPLSLFSIFGLVALTGIVVNDSIVLIDFINHRVRDGMPVIDALIESGRRRFRPVLLTSITTVAGMTPILMETSLQAQLLIPMAASLCFGLILATVIVLFLAPTSYYLYRLILGDVEMGSVGGTKSPRVRRPRREDTDRGELDVGSHDLVGAGEA